MWRTDLGERVLSPPEASLFRAGLGSLISLIDAHHGTCKADVEVFDRLSLSEKLGILDVVARGLLDPNTPCPQLSAVSEGAIGAVFYQIKREVDAEIRHHRSVFRPLIRSACKEMGMNDDLPRVTSTDWETWDICIEALMDLILFDRDWEEEFIPPDAPPALAKLVKESMSIDDDYYSAAAPDPSSRQLERIRQHLRELIAGT